MNKKITLNIIGILFGILAIIGGLVTKNVTVLIIGFLGLIFNLIQL